MGVTINSIDVVIIGSGLAALTAAERLSNEKNVIILTKSKWTETNSMKAQGGVAASVSSTDSWQKHLEDTIAAGCYVNNVEVVKRLVRKGPECVNQLIKSGLNVDRNVDGTIQLGKEGAHQERRIIHAGGDATGKVLMEFIYQRVKNKVTILEDQMVLDLLVEDGKCIGVVSSNSSNQRSVYFASHIVLATGGCGGLYQVTSNNPTITGDGIALAYRAGAELEDLEFIQFHPTMLYTNNSCYGLVSEAVRGEGAQLINENGVRIMKGVHPLEDLAPRDVVARQLQLEMNRGRSVYLDISMISDFQKKFPTITAICNQAGINLSACKIPVAPGAHFIMGGVKTDTNGCTSVKGLYAIGEVASTGVHGANRLASNSLLEGIVFSNLLADFISKQESHQKHHQRTKAPYKNNNNPEVLPILPEKKEINEIMSVYVGIERSQEGLLFAKNWMEQFDVNRLMNINAENLDQEKVGVINQLITCWLIITSALERTESRGSHFRSDFPLRDPNWEKVHIVRFKNRECVQVQREMIGVGK